MSVQPEFIHLEREGDVLTITLNRPSVNAFNAQMHAELAAVLRSLPTEKETRAVILTGSGRVFSAGGDLGWFDQIETADQYEQVMRETNEILGGIIEAPQPVIAMVNGAAVGLGASLALCCDIVYAAESAKFSDPHVQVGLVAGDGGAALWPLLIGPARAKEYLLTGDTIKAPEAARIGLVNRAIPDSELAPTTKNLAHKLAAAAPLAVRWTKQAVNQGVKATALQVLATSMGLEGIAFRTEDCQEALRAIREKRKPIFRGF